MPSEACADGQVLSVNVALQASAIDGLPSPLLTDHESSFFLATSHRLHSLFAGPSIFTSPLYSAFRRTQKNLPLAGLVYVVCLAVLASRGSVASLPGLSPPASSVFNAAFALTVVAVATGALSLVRMGGQAASTGADGGESESVHRWPQWLLTELSRPRWNPADNVYVFTLSTSLAMYVLARVLAGACPAGITAWGAQSCNPQASLHGVPLDMHALAMAAPLIAQVFFRGAGGLTVVAAWVAVVVLYNAAHAASGAAPDAYVWVNLEFAVRWCARDSSRLRSLSLTRPFYFCLQPTGAPRAVVRGRAADAVRFPRQAGECRGDL